LRDADVIDLYERVGVGTKVVVLPSDYRRQVSRVVTPQLSDRGSVRVMTTQRPVQHAVDASEPRTALNSSPAMAGIY
jgi:hypothetical protein